MRTERRRAGSFVVLGSAGLLVAGCASMPDRGDVRPVDSSPRGDARVRVFGVAPREGARPMEVVEGFLEALTSEDPDYAVARKYLTDGASKKWRPEQSTTVLTDAANAHALAQQEQSREEPREYTYQLTGREIAQVDEQLAYRPREADYHESIHLTLEAGKDKKKEWRIDRLPSGVVLGQTDFQRLYWPVNKYYYASRAADGTRSQQALVADPIYVRSWEDPVTETVRALLKGPTNWLSGVVDSRFPSHTELQKGTRSLTPDDQNLLVVPLNKSARDISPRLCQQMAAQLLYSLRDLTATSVDQVELRATNGSPLCVLDEDQAENLASSRTTGHLDYQYFLDKEHRLVRMSGGTRGGDGHTEVAVPGPLGAGEQALRSAAVSRDEQLAAGVSLDGRKLFVSELDGKKQLRDTTVRSAATDEKDRLSTPSWDGFGDLWVTDRDPDRSRLLWLSKGTGKPVEVQVAGLGAKARIESVRVSADGARIALLVRDGKTTSLRIGRVERSGGAGEPGVAVAGLRVAAPQMEEVTAMSWAGGSRLVVVGRESRGVQQLRYVQSDGSVPAKLTLPGLTGVTDVAAAEDPGLALVAHSDDGIVQLPPGGSWQTVLKEGTAPFYPG